MAQKPGLFTRFVTAVKSMWAAGPVPCWTDYLHDANANQR